jgi:purine-binding chemotaxis protein CheW
MTKTAGEKGESISSAASGQAEPAGLAAPRKAENRSGKLQVVEFLLGKEHYAIDLFDVREVVEYTSITQLPNTASYMKGIIDLRGEITTIIDLKERLNIMEKSEQPIENSRIIVLDEKITRAKTGILVDDVLAVSTFERGEIDNTSASGGREDAAINGIIKKKVKDKDHDKNELIIWIDIRHLLADIGQD